MPDNSQLCEPPGAVGDWAAAPAIAIDNSADLRGEWLRSLTPSTAFWAFLCLHVAVWTITPFVCCPNAPLDSVEMVYWGREWQWGYPKHPPLVGWVAAAIVSVTGASTWGLFLGSQLAVGVALWCAWRLGREIVGPRAALLGVLAMEGCAFFNFDGVVLNNNVGLYPFWALGSLCFYWALRRQSLGYWIATGICVGLGMLCKYSMIFLPLTACGLMLFNPQARAVWRRPGPYVAILVAVLVLAPHLYWASQNGFPGIFYARARVEGDGSLLGRLSGPVGFFFSQLLVLSLVAIIVWPLLGFHWRLRAIAARERFNRDFLVTMTLGPFALLLLISLVFDVRFRPMHGSHLWPFASLTLLYLFERQVDRKRAWQSVTLGAVAGALLLLAFVIRNSAGPYVIGRPAREHFPGAQLSTEIDKLWRQRFGGPLEMVAGDPWLAGNIAFYSSSSPRFYSGGHCTWLLRDEVLRHGGVIVWDAADCSTTKIPELFGDWPSAEVCAPLVLKQQTLAKVASAVVGIAIVRPSLAAKRSAPLSPSHEGEAPKSGSGNLHFASATQER